MGGVVDTIGGAVGDVVGGLAGGIVGKGGQKMAGGGITGIGNSTGLDLNYGAQIANRNGDIAGQTKASDAALLSALQGNGPSIAQNQLQSATDANIAQQSSLAASARGGNVALAQRTASNNAAMAQQQAANQSAMIRAQEMQAAQQNMLSSLGQKDAYSTAMQKAGNERDLGAAGIEEKGKSRSQEGSEAFSKMVSGGITAIAASDKNSKKNVKDGGDSIDNFLNALSAKSYEYKDKNKKDPGAGYGNFLSVMAQDLEKTQKGKSMVKDTPKGKVVDYGKGFGTMLAAMARINERLNDMEGSEG